MTTLDKVTRSFSHSFPSNIKSNLFACSCSSSSAAFQLNSRVYGCSDALRHALRGVCSHFLVTYFLNMGGAGNRTCSRRPGTAASTAMRCLVTRNQSERERKQPRRDQKMKLSSLVARQSECAYRVCLCVRARATHHFLVHSRRSSW